MSSYNWPPSAGSSGGVTSVNSLTGAVILSAGTGITLTPSSNTITIAATGAGAALTKINNDTTTAQTLTVGTSGTDFGINDAGGGSHVFNLPTASASNRGALSSADWSTFSAKQSALTLGNISDVGTDGITVTGGTGAVIGSGVTLSQHVADSTHNGYLSSTDWSTFNGKQTAGTYVTAISIASSNGLAGSSSGGATPTLTLSTSITGILKGNGTAISTATSGTDYAPGTSALATGIVKSTTTTGSLSIAASGVDYSAGTSSLATGILKSTTSSGALSIAVAADFPTLNQNTSGTAAGLSATLVVGSGGTGQTTLAAHGVVLGNGSSGVSVSGAGTAGQVLTSNGASADPTFQSVALPVLVGVRYNGSTSSITSSQGIVIYNNKDYDANTDYGTGTGFYTVPSTGYYLVIASLQISATFTLNNFGVLQIVYDGTIVCDDVVYAAASLATVQPFVQTTIKCTAGKVIQINAQSSGSSPSVSGAASRSVLSITKVGV